MSFSCTTPTLQRAQPILPLDFEQPERRTHSYVRHRTLDLSAALNVGSGEVLAPIAEPSVARASIAS